MAPFFKRAQGDRFTGGSRSVLLAAGAVLAAQSVPIAHAAESGAVQIEEVMVTASRRSESLQDIAMAVTVTSPTDFVNTGITTMKDIVNYSPGVVYRGGSAPIDNGLTMRGVSTMTSSPTVGVYIDDVPIGSGNGQASGASLLLDVMKAGMERVELIKGPQGTLYGASSMGGIMRYVTPDASKDGVKGAVSADFSSIDHGGSSARYTGRISAPIAADRAGVFLSGYYEDVGGFIDRIPQSASGAATDVNGHKNYGGMGKVDVNFTDRFSASVLALYDKTTFHGRNVVTLDGPPFELAYGKYETDTAYSDDDSELKVGALTFNYEFDFADFISTTSYQERLVTSTTDLVADFGPLINLFCACTVDNAPFTGAYSTDRFVQELRLVSGEAARDAGNFEWSVGAVYSKEESGNGQRLEGLPTGFLLLDVDVPSELEELAGFANLTYYVTPNFDLTAGVRVADIEATVAVDDGPEILLGDTPPTVVDDTIDTYSFSARYRPTDELSLYARIASGYRPAAANLPLAGASPIIETDTLWSYEIGAKGVPSSGLFSYDLTAWYLHWSNLQARVYVNGAQTGGNANSDVTAYGFEGAISFSPSDTFTLTASAAYTDSTLDDDETSAFGAVAGESMPGVPEWTLAVRASKNVILGAETSLAFGLGVRYQGDANTGFVGGVGANGDPIEPLIDNFTVDSWWQTDVSVAFKHRNFGATVYATNLFDEYGFSGGLARPAVGFVRATANVIQPRTYGAILTYDF